MSRDNDSNLLSALMGAVVFAAFVVGLILYDLRRPNSLIRNLIEIGRSRLEGDAIEADEPVEEAGETTDDEPSDVNAGEDSPRSVA